MFKLACTVLVMNLSFLAIAPGLFGTCKLCEDIREKNRQNPSSGYTYYEDYLKAQGNEKGAQVNQNPAPKNNDVNDVKATTPAPNNNVKATAPAPNNNVKTTVPAPQKPQ